MLLTVSVSGFGQINFEKGYFKDNEGEKTECFIKDNDWLKNPTAFKYKLSENGKIKDAGIDDVKEFSVPGSFKYIRVDVDMDTSSSDINKLSSYRTPLWKHEQLFLKVLVEGKASLFYYYDGEFERFFYSVNDTSIKQLVYKEFLNANGQVVPNNSFIQQLFNHVNCSVKNINAIENT